MQSCSKTKRGVKFDEAHFGKIFTHMPTVYIYIEKKNNIRILQQHLIVTRSLQLQRSSPPEVFLGKCVLKICSKFTGEYTCRSVISIKL